jgi:broad specificity phosphatase PhoE
MAFKKVMKAVKKPGIWLIRHGATDFNGEGGTSVDKIRGWIDVPLNAVGIEDAHKAAKKVKKDAIDAVYSSDLSRAKQTALIIHTDNKIKAPIIYSQDLRPWNLGIYEGKETSKVIDDLNRMVKNEDIVAPQGESFKAFRERYLNAVKKIMMEAVTKHEQILIITHYRNLKTLDAWIQNGAPDNMEVDKNVMIKDSFKTGEVYPVNLDKILFPKK